MTSAVSAAMPAQRTGSSWAMPAIVAPTSIEMAEVGPIASWREVPKSAYDQAADQVAVDAVVRRQPGERRVGERHRDAVGRERHAGDGVMRAADCGRYAGSHCAGGNTARNPRLNFVLAIRPPLLF